MLEAVFTELKKFKEINSASRQISRLTGVTMTNKKSPEIDSLAFWGLGTLVCTLYSGCLEQ